MLGIEEVARDAEVFRPDGVIVIPRSDGDRAFNAPTAPTSRQKRAAAWHYQTLTSQHKSHIEWRNTIADMLRLYFNLPERSPSGAKWRLNRMPRHYSIAEARKEDQADRNGRVRMERQVHVFVRRSHKYRSPAEIIDHLIWLLRDIELDEDKCRCQRCPTYRKNGSSQSLSTLSIINSRRKAELAARLRGAASSSKGEAEKPSLPQLSIEDAAKNENIFSADGLISIPRSDGKRVSHPFRTATPNTSESEVDYYDTVQRKDPRYIVWCNTMGELLQDYFHLPDLSESGAPWRLRALPKNYILSEHHSGPRADQSHDVAVYGPDGHTFRTPWEMLKHMAWLICDPNLDTKNCKCRYCVKENTLAAGAPTNKRRRTRAPSESFSDSLHDQDRDCVPAASSVRLLDVEMRPFKPTSAVCSVPQRDEEISRNIKRGYCEGFRVGEVVWCSLPKPVSHPTDKALQIYGWPAVILYITTSTTVMPQNRRKQEFEDDTAADEPTFTLRNRVFQRPAYQINFLGTMENTLIEERRLFPYIVGFIHPETLPKELGAIEQHAWLATEDAEAPPLNLMRLKHLPDPDYIKSIVAFAYAVHTADMLRSFYSLTDAFSVSTSPEKILQDLGSSVRGDRSLLACEGPQLQGKRYYQGLHYGTERIWVGEVIRLRLSPGDVSKLQEIMNAALLPDTPKIYLDPDASYVMRLASIFEDPNFDQKAQVSGELFQVLTAEKYRAKETERDPADQDALDAEGAGMTARLPKATTLSGVSGFPAVPPLPHGFRLVSLNELLQTRVAREATLSIGYIAGRFYPSLGRPEDAKMIEAEIAARPTDKKIAADEDTRSEERARLSAAGLLSGCVKAMGCKLDSYSLIHSLRACLAISRTHTRDLVLQQSPWVPKLHRAARPSASAYPYIVLQSSASSNPNSTPDPPSLNFSQSTGSKSSQEGVKLTQISLTSSAGPASSSIVVPAAAISSTVLGNTVQLTSTAQEASAKVNPPLTAVLPAQPVASALAAASSGSPSPIAGLPSAEASEAFLEAAQPVGSTGTSASPASTHAKSTEASEQTFRTAEFAVSRSSGIDNTPTTNAASPSVSSLVTAASPASPYTQIDKGNNLVPQTTKSNTSPSAAAANTTAVARHQLSAESRPVDLQSAGVFSRTAEQPKQAATTAYKPPATTYLNTLVASPNNQQMPPVAVSAKSALATQSSSTNSAVVRRAAVGHASTNAASPAKASAQVAASPRPIVEQVRKAQAQLPPKPPLQAQLPPKPPLQAQLLPKPPSQYEGTPSHDSRPSSAQTQPQQSPRQAMPAARLGASLYTSTMPNNVLSIGKSKIVTSQRPEPRPQSAEQRLVSSSSLELAGVPSAQQGISPTINAQLGPHTSSATIPGSSAVNSSSPSLHARPRSIGSLPRPEHLVRSPLSQTLVKSATANPVRPVQHLQARPPPHCIGTLSNVTPAVKSISSSSLATKKQESNSDRKPVNTSTGQPSVPTRPEDALRFTSLGQTSLLRGTNANKYSASTVPQQSIGPEQSRSISLYRVVTGQERVTQLPESNTKSVVTAPTANTAQIVTVPALSTPPTQDKAFLSSTADTSSPLPAAATTVGGTVSQTSGPESAMAKFEELSKKCPLANNASPVNSPSAVAAAAAQIQPTQTDTPFAQGATSDDAGPLPPAWTTRHSRNTGKMFYYNTVTKATRWSRPT